MAVISQVVQPFYAFLAVSIKWRHCCSPTNSFYTDVKKRCFFPLFPCFSVLVVISLSVSSHFWHSSSRIAWITVSRFRIEFQPLTAYPERREYISIELLSCVTQFVFPDLEILPNMTSFVSKSARAVVQWVLCVPPTWILETLHSVAEYMCVLCDCVSWNSVTGLIILMGLV